MSTETLPTVASHPGAGRPAARWPRLLRPRPIGHGAGRLRTAANPSGTLRMRSRDPAARLSTCCSNRSVVDTER